MAYEQEFNRLYRSRPFFDVLGRQVLFNRDAARHVCFKAPDKHDRYFKSKRTDWLQERAERIPWIGHALVAPWELRPNHQVPKRRQSYLLVVPPGQVGPKVHRFFVVVEIGDKPGHVQFVTAFPVFEVKYWNQSRQGGACLYPPEKMKGKNK